MRIGVAASACCLALICGGGISRLADAQATASHLSFAQESQLVVPDSLDILGATQTGGGDVWLWTPRPGVLYEWKRGTAALQPVAVGGTIVAAAADALTGEIDVVDGLRGAIVPIADGQVGAGRTTGLVSIFDAHKHGDHWLLFGVDSGGSARFAECRYDGCHVVAAPNRQALVDLRRHARKLTQVGAADVLLEVNPPFRRFDLTGRELARAETRRLNSRLRAIAAGARWVALTPVQIGGQTVMQFADLKSDLRVLVLTGSTGVIVRTTTLDAPFGLLTATDGSSAVGARRANGVTLIEYRVMRR